MQVFGGEKQSMNSGVLGKHKDRMQKSIKIITSSLDGCGSDRKAMK